MTVVVDSLAALFDPVSVVVVGASDDERKWGNWLGRAALTGPRPAYLVNRSRDVVLGRASYRSVADVPGPVGLVALCVPAPQVPEAVDDALAAGAAAVVGIAAGFAETGDGGRRVEEEMARRVRSAGARLLGPNCLGLFDAASDLRLTSNPLPSGRVALLSQSGNLSLDLAGLLVEHGLGFSRFVSVGNQADIELPELIESCADHADTDVIAVYCRAVHRRPPVRRGGPLGREAGRRVGRRVEPRSGEGCGFSHRFDGLGVGGHRRRVRRGRRLPRPQPRRARGPVGIARGPGPTGGAPARRPHRRWWACRRRCRAGPPVRSRRTGALRPAAGADRRPPAVPRRDVQPGRRRRRRRAGPALHPPGGGRPARRR